MNWLYKGEEMTSLESFPPSTFGFIYRVIHIPSGKAYIGKKFVKFTRKAKLTKKDDLHEQIINDAGYRHVEPVVKQSHGKPRDDVTF